MDVFGPVFFYGLKSPFINRHPYGINSLNSDLAWLSSEEIQDKAYYVYVLSFVILWSSH